MNLDHFWIVVVNLVVKTLAKEHIGETFERTATNLQQKKVELSDKIHLNLYHDEGWFKVKSEKS